MELVILFVQISLMVHLADSQDIAKSVRCSPHIGYVHSDPKYHNFIPYMFEIHRCVGADENPAYKKCVPTSDGIKTAPLRFFKSDAGVMETKIFQNHTKCHLVCVKDENTCSPYETYDAATCSCNCKDNTVDDNRICTPPFKFKRTSNNCDCVCPESIRQATCNLNKVFSEEDCGCVCKKKFFKRCARKKMVIDEACNCVEPPTNAKTIGGKDCKGGVTGGVLAVIVIFEAVCFVGGYFLFYVYCYKRQYKPQQAEKRQRTLDTGTFDNGNKIHLFYDEHPTDEVPSDRRHNEMEEAVEKLKNRESQVKYSTSNSLYPDDEKSPLTPKSTKSDDYDMYNDILETEDDMHYFHPPSNTDTYSNSDIYDGSGYASVTQV